MKWITLLLVSLIFITCRTKNKSKSEITTPINILVDESFKPIIEDQYLVYENSYPQTKFNLIYKPEVRLVNTLLKDSVSVAIMSRKLLPKEASYFERKNIKIKTSRIATDAVALVTHVSSTDSTITVDEIKSILKGASSGINLVFDNPNSSTVRYLRDLAGVSQLPIKGVYALNSTTDVIKYVHNNPGTIGVIGINWIKQPPVELEPLVAKLKVMAIKNSAGAAGGDKFYKPSQDNLAQGLYPLSRELYIIDCKGGTVGTGFAAFVIGERGQRIILKSGLLPDKIPSRQLIIRKTITP